MSFDPVSYLMGTKAGGGGSSVTVEPLTVAENGTYTAPSGKAYSPVTVAVPGIEVVEYTFTAAEEMKNYVVIPLPPKQKIPLAIEMITPVNGTEIEDFPIGDVVSLFTMPAPDDELVYKRQFNCLCTYRNASSGRVSQVSFPQLPSDASIVSNTYKILNDEFFASLGNNGLLSQGVTYSVKCYYIAG